VVHIDTQEMEQLTHGNTDQRPQWSRDGQNIIFGRATQDTNSDGKISTYDNQDLFVMELSTSDITRVTNTPDADDFQFVFSPDGVWIAFCSVRRDVNGDGVRNLDDSQDMFLVRINGQDERRLNLGGKTTFSPDWSPNGEKIVVSVYFGQGQLELWVYDVESGTYETITSRGPYYHAEWAK